MSRLAESRYQTEPDLNIIKYFVESTLYVGIMRPSILIYETLIFYLTNDTSTQ